MRFIRSLFAQLGFEGQELETRILAFVGYMRMVHATDDSDVSQEHLRHFDERRAVLMGK